MAVDAFLSPVDLKRSTVQVPGLGAVLVREIMADEWDEIESACLVVDGDKQRFRARRALVVRYGAINDNGSHRFGDGDLAALGSRPFRQINPVYAEIERLSGVRETGEQRGNE